MSGRGIAREEGPSAPAFVLDAGPGSIVAANPAGWRLWGIDDRGDASPVSVDRAMPALQRLRDLAASGQTLIGAEESLILWTRKGVRSIRCSITGPEPPLPSTVFALRIPETRPWEPSGRNDDEYVERARLAHEIRTPLSAVISYAEILKDQHFGPLGNERYRLYASHIFESARHMLLLTDCMLQDYSERCGPARLVFTNVSLVAVAESCLIVARPLAERAGIDLTACLQPSVPHVVADELSLKQVLLNLLGNAIKFVRRGDRVNVAVACVADNALEMSVSDTGPGMMDLDSTVNGGNAWRHDPSGGRGLGFGLPLARKLAEANGATLGIDTKPGRGTRVTVAFPKDRLVPI